MPKKEYGWDRGNVPIIGEHSLAKHRILRTYVEKYIEILTINPRIDRFSLTLIDAFAGGGIYRRAGDSNPHLGSPAILIEAAAAASALVKASRTKPIVINPSFIFIEKNPANVKALEDTLRNHIYPKHPGVQPTIITGAFEERLRSVVDTMKRPGRTVRAIFLLDQYGYTAVPLSSLRLIFRELPQAEVFLTLAVGWIAGYLKSASGARDVIRNALRIKDEASEDEIEDVLLGGNNSAEKLRIVQKILHDTFVQESGANYATPFFIVSRGSNRPYWFLHLANSARANDVVKSLHWDMQNHFSHFGDSGLAMLGFDPGKETELSQLRFAFDATARERTHQSLLEQLPEHILQQHRDGVPFETLFASITNETPATKAMASEAITRLCREGVLVKRGGSGEQRRVETAVLDKDIVAVSRQTRIIWG